MPEEAILPLTSPKRRPTSERPLLGLTVLVVEDSRFACEALRLLCLRSGARIRRADCLSSAHRHLGLYQPTVAIIDMGLPDGSGADLIGELNLSDPRIPVILATSGDSSLNSLAMAAGADGFMEKPVLNLAYFQEAILSFLPSIDHPKGPRIVGQQSVDPDPIAFRDDLSHISDILSVDKNADTVDYIAQFLSSIAKSATDKPLADAASSLLRVRKEGTPFGPDVERIVQLVSERLTVLHPI